MSYNQQQHQQQAPAPAAAPAPVESDIKISGGFWVEIPVGAAHKMPEIAAAMKAAALAIIESDPFVEQTFGSNPFPEPTNNSHREIADGRFFDQPPAQHFTPVHQQPQQQYRAPQQSYPQRGQGGANRGGYQQRPQAGGQRTWLNAGYHDREFVKAQGARYDAASRRWYVDGPVSPELAGFVIMG